MRAEPTYATQRSEDRYTDGPVVAAAIEKWLGRRPTVSQQMELDVALERIDGPGSRFAFDDVIIIKGRRCGKTVTSLGVPHARSLAGPVTLPNGRRLPFRAVHVAQNLTSARQRFDEDLVGPYRQHFTDEAWALAAEYKRGAADTALTLDPRHRKNLERAKILRVASEMRVLAPSPSAARGSGVFHRTYDEELTYTLQRGQDLTSAGRPTMAELHGQAQTWHMSNVGKFVDKDYFLWHQRETGRKAVREDRRSGICYIEYSLPPGTDPNDEAEWWRYYPALGEGLVDVRDLHRDREVFENIHHDGGAAFFAEYFGRWSDENETGVAGWKAIQLQDYLDALTVELEQPADLPAVIGVDMDPFYRSSTITAAVQLPEGPILVEVLDHQPNTEWVTDAVLALVGDVAAICIDDYGPGHALVDDLSRMPVVADKLVTTHGQDFAAACYGFEAKLRERSLKIRKSDYHERLTNAAAAAERTPGRSWQWERRVNPSQTPLVSSTLAVWALEHRPVLAPVSQIF